MAQALCGSGLADSLRFEGRDGLVVGTHRPRDVAELVAATAHDAGIVTSRITAGDQTLEGVFDRLVQLHRGVGP